MAALASALGLSGLARLGWGCPITTASPTHAAQSVPQVADLLRPCRGATDELGIFSFPPTQIQYFAFKRLIADPSAR